MHAQIVIGGRRLAVATALVCAVVLYVGWTATGEGHHPHNARSAVPRLCIEPSGAEVCPGAPAPHRSGARVRSATDSMARPLDAFALELLRHLGGRGNLVTSPYSVAMSLGMVGAGAAHRTVRQIEKVLHAASLTQMTGGLESLRARLSQEQSVAGKEDPRDAAQLTTADGSWVQTGFAVKPAFQDTIATVFDAPLQSENFEAGPQSAVNDINGWVAGKTKGIVQNVLAPDAIDRSTRMVIASAIYLDAHWALPFDPKNTQTGAFVTTSGKRRAVAFMRQNSTFRYASGPSYRAVDLPYLASDLSMLIVMPDREALPDFQAHFGVRQLNRVVYKLSKSSIELGMPRFRLDCGIQLNTALSSMGMPDAFHPLMADFSGIAGKPGALYLSLVEHAADLQVGEQGTVATAATVEVIKAISAPIVRHRATFTLNHPFLYFIRDDGTGTILFAGRLVDPGQSC